MNTMQYTFGGSREKSAIPEVCPQDEDFILRQLNIQFVNEDAAIIQDVAASCDFNYERAYKALSDMFNPSEEAQNKLMTNVPKVTNQQHLQYNTVGSRRLHAQPSSIGQVITSNVTGEASGDKAIRSAASVVEAVPTWGGPNRMTGAIRKTPCTIKNNRKAVKSSANKSNVDRIKRMLMDKWNVMVLLRGLPGSGKSFLSKELTNMADECGFVYQVCSADYYFQRPDGQYIFNPQELQEAHSYSQQKARTAILQKTPLVIIDNTNICDWEMKPYLINACNSQYHIELLEPNTQWKFNVAQLKEKNVHKVPDKSIKGMKEKYTSFQIEDLLKLYKLPNTNQKVLPEIKPLMEPMSIPLALEPKILNEEVGKILESSVYPLSDDVESPSTEEDSPNVPEPVEIEEIDLEGVPENARDMYRTLPEMYPKFDKHLVWELFRESSFDQEYFFEAMKNSEHLLGKNMDASRPLITPIKKQPPKIVVSEQHTKVAVKTELSEEAQLLKKKLEAMIIIPKIKKERELPPPCPVEATVEIDQDESSQSSESEEYDAILDRDFANSLLSNFGGPFHIDDLEDSALRVKIPSSVALKIHSLWMGCLQDHINSQERRVQQQLDYDYALAHSLNEREQTVQERPQERPQMEDIMEMEKALAAVKRCQIGESKNDMATKMSLTKLFDEFPNMDQKAVQDIFEDRGRDYNESAKAIKAIYESEDSVKNVYTQEALQLKEEQLIEQVKKESLKSLEVAESKKPLFVEVNPRKQQSPSDEENMVKEISRYREEAYLARKGKWDALKQSEISLQKKMGGVASYYSEIAKSWEVKLEKANSMVSHLILQNASIEFLDLHYVYVSEALVILDLFLDWHVERRIENPSVGTEMVEIVTGRGNRSEGGKAKIKPAVMKRLKKREVKFEESNPGALRVYINKGLKFSTSKANSGSDED